MPRTAAADLPDRDDWRAWLKLRERSTRPPVPVEDALGRVVVDPWEQKRWRRFKQCKKVCKAMERLGFSPREITWYVQSGWESETYQLTQEQFQAIVLALARCHKAKVL